VAIGLLILSEEVFDSRRVGRLLSGGEEGPVGGEERAVEDDSRTPGNGAVLGLEQS